MSRFTIKPTEPNIRICYGYDRMIPDEGYFIQVFDDSKEDETPIIEEGLIHGLSSEEMINSFTKIIEHYHVDIDERLEKHLNAIVLEIPI